MKSESRTQWRFCDSRGRPDYLRAKRNGRAVPEPDDVEASLKAGIRVVALRCGGWGDADLKRAVEIYDDPADLLGRFDQSPFAGGST